MELPFLKNKKNQGGGGPYEVARKSDDNLRADNQMENDLMDQVADELLQAIETKNKTMLRDALKALVLHIQDEDAEQDQESAE